MKRKKVTLLVTFVFLSILVTCITVPILYSKSWRDSRTTMPSTSATTTKTGHLTSNKVDETTLSYGTSATSKYSTVAVTTAAIASTTASVEGSSTKPLITIEPTTSKSNSTTTTTTQSAAQSTTATPFTTTKTTPYHTKNPCFEHKCETGETCFEIDDKATCVSVTIGFLTHDKLVMSNIL